MLSITKGDRPMTVIGTHDRRFDPGFYEVAEIFAPVT